MAFHGLCVVLFASMSKNQCTVVLLFYYADL